MARYYSALWHFILRLNAAGYRIVIPEHEEVFIKAP